jgi:hypothetical protein
MINHYYLNRREDVIRYVNPNGVGIELGVAEGEFSERILRETENSDFYLYSVDMWAGDRGHDVAQYSRVIQRFEKYKSRNSIIKLKFDEALPLFPDNYFDFIYVDGYAHTGEENGKTFYDWFPKLKNGGVMAGDDYHDNWPLVKSSVDLFSSRIGRDLHVINCHEPNSVWSEYPTWFIFK